MTEVFIPFSEKTSSIHDLGWTLEAWNTDDYEPIALQVKNTSNDKIVRVAAEAIANGREYIIAELCTEPGNPKGWARYKKGHGLRVEACGPRVH